MTINKGLLNVAAIHKGTDEIVTITKDGVDIYSVGNSAPSSNVITASSFIGNTTIGFANDSAFTLTATSTVVDSDGLDGGTYEWLVDGVVDTSDTDNNNRYTVTRPGANVISDVTLQNRFTDSGGLSIDSNTLNLRFRNENECFLNGNTSRVGDSSNESSNNVALFNFAANQNSPVTITIDEDNTTGGTGIGIGPIGGPYTSSHTITSYTDVVIPGVPTIFLGEAFEVARNGGTGVVVLLATQPITTTHQGCDDTDNFTFLPLNSPATSHTITSSVPGTAAAGQSVTLTSTIVDDDITDGVYFWRVNNDAETQNSFASGAPSSGNNVGIFNSPTNTITISNTGVTNTYQCFWRDNNVAGEPVIASNVLTQTWA